MLQLEKFEKEQEETPGAKSAPTITRCQTPKEDLLHENVVTVETATVVSAFDHDRVQAAETLLLFQNFEKNQVS